jgi:ribosomal-protein-alanine N-acetyltransferase
VEDLDEVMRIMGRAFRPCFGEGWTLSQCAGILPMSGVTLTIGEDDGNAIGFALARAVSDEAELLLIAVDPERQGHGAGSSLLQDFIATARAGGASRLHLEVGFVPAGRRRNYYRGPDGKRYDAVTLMLIEDTP